MKCANSQKFACDEWRRLSDELAVEHCDTKTMIQNTEKREEPSLRQIYAKLNWKVIL